MKFEHLVAINDPDSPSSLVLSRDQVWFGLLCRAEDPRPFLPGLDECVILGRSEHSLVRALRFGQTVIHDEVTLVPMQSVCFETPKTPEHAGGSLTISIEEPGPDLLVLRFIYRTSLPDHAGDPDGAYAGFVKSAYHSSDLDTVRVIRSIAENIQIQ